MEGRQGRGDRDGLPEGGLFWFLSLFRGLFRGLWYTFVIMGNDEHQLGL